MEELITLNQLKAYDDEKTNIWHNNFTTNNLTAENVNVSNFVANNASFGSINANGKLGDNGQVLGKNNGVLEWMNVSGGGSVDTDNLIVNNITINNSATVYGDVFTHKGFDVASTKLIPEDDYNNLGSEARNDAFYITGPNGNMYFMGMKWTPSYVPTYPGSYVAYVDLPKMANNMQTLTTSTLTFTSDAVTNSFVNGGKYNGISKKTPFGVETWDNTAPIGTQANNGSIITNANELYIVDASHLYYSCRRLTDTFISNSLLITNAPRGYNPLKYCTNMNNTFYGCSNFNQPVNIPNSVTNMYQTFARCYNFNQPVNIPNSVTSLVNTFQGCSNFNQPVNIPNSVTELSFTFQECRSFNQPVNIPNSVTNMYRTFYNCASFNQPVNIPNSVTSWNNTFARCSSFNQPVNIPNSVTSLESTFAICYNFNQPVNIPNSVTNMYRTFQGCSNFNQPVNIPNSVTELSFTFQECRSFNQPVNIPNSVTDLSVTFARCYNFNQPVNIPNSVTELSSTFASCSNFNQPVNIPNSVKRMLQTFVSCSNFNQPVNIPNSVTNMYQTFYDCTTLSSSTVPIHISHTIALGNTSNYIYNCLVNNYTGIAFDPSRILNDL